MTDTEHDQHLSDEAREKLLAARAQVQDATFDVLVKKPVRETAFFVHVAADDGRDTLVRIRYRALSPRAFDRLVEAHPPTAKGQREGHQWHKDTFPPALIAAVSLAPRLSVEQATELLESDNWAAGEVNALFTNALVVCNAGLDVPFSAGD